MGTGIIIFIAIMVILVVIFGFIADCIVYKNSIIENLEEEIELFRKTEYRLINKLKEQADVVVEGWVAKDANGSVFLYGSKPIKSLETGSWYVDTENDLYVVSSRLFPKLTWEDEPIKISITYKK